MSRLVFGKMARGFFSTTEKQTMGEERRRLLKRSSNVEVSESPNVSSRFLVSPVYRGAIMVLARGPSCSPQELLAQMYEVSVGTVLSDIKINRLKRSRS